MPAKKLTVCLLAIGLSLFSLFLFVSHSRADELDDINNQIKKLNDDLNSSVAATKPLESQLKSMQSQIDGIKSRVYAIEVDVAVKKKDIEKGYADLTQKEALLQQTVRSFYIKSYSNSPFLMFLSAKSASQVAQLMAYQQAKTDEDKTVITNLALSISSLEDRKAALEDEQSRLVAVKASLDVQSKKLDDVIQGAKAYQSTLTNQIAQLSAKQQELLAQKLGSLNIPQSAYTTQGGCVDDRNVDPGFSPRFALFTFGVPNRVGMNQYGAKGRAEAGQNAETILSAYYNADLNKSYDTGITITVNGTNEYGQSFNNQQWNIEDYVKHVYEMPTNWSSEALKAQAVAARSYVLNYTNNGQKPICPSQSCQVVKQEENSQAWKDAVDATRGWVLTSGGQPITAWFSSTHGGYMFKSSDIGWSSTAWTKNGTDASGSINSFDDLFNNAYDKSSPWFYCDWGARSAYKGTAWLKSEELADIVNVILLAKADSSTQKHLSQIDKPNPDGTDTWDADRVKQELRSRGGNPYNSISSLDVDWDKGTGVTTSVNISGDAGSTTFSGSEFKSYFNLRAPSNINIVGPLFKAEKR